MEVKEILSKCDHTLLAQTATWKEIRAICDDGMKYGCASVCIPASYVKQAAEYVAGKLPICTVIGFPNGYDTTAAKCFMATDAVENGAEEVDMVINLGWVKDQKWDDLLAEIKAVKAACKGRLLKVIIECCFLTDEEKIKMCEIVTASGAEDIKTSLSNRTISFERGEGKHTISLSVESTGHQEYVAQIEQLSSLHKRVNNIMGNEAHFRFQDIIGISPAMGEAVRMAKIAAQNDASVFLSGESGTGKELFAQAIHNASSRRRGPFIAVNCGALPKSLIEAELFGYEGGSFTGARRDGCAGKFELANGGTIFLDEIGDMPVDVQITLLRVLQNREVRRIGASKALRIDVRVITATNRDLEQLVDSKVFREDLFYRINVFRINIPSLRERTGDVRQLAGFFLAKYSDIRPGGRVEGFTAEALAMMEAYPWPGNVRQLENSVERAVYLAEGELVTAAELPPEIRAFQGSAPSPAVPAAAGESPSGGEGEDEAARIQDMLHRTHGNVMEAARLLGISRRTLYRKLQRYHIDYSSHRI